MLRLFPSAEPAIWLPVDDALISGPVELLRNPLDLYTEALLKGVDAILGFRSALTLYRGQLERTSFIANLTASTTRGDHTRKILCDSVADAVRSGADAVACHLNVTSSSENEMIANVGHVVRQAEALGVPVVVIAYPRRAGSAGSTDDFLELRESDPAAYGRLVLHSVRLAVELGASAVKTKFTGSAESFSMVVDGACGVPVLIAGEALCPAEEAIQRASSAVQVGAAGVAFGRQIFARKDPVDFVSRLRDELQQAFGHRIVRVPAGEA
jgi:DhnA family fructose-bisphosphate aldolase class Ia